MPKLFLIGKTGQLGAEILKDAPLFDFQMVAYGHSEFDITEPTKTEAEIERQQPDIIINTAAFNAVAECEKRPREAFLVNTIAVAGLAKIAKKTGARFVTFSTDYVFDGEKGEPYTEEDIPCPLQMYGISKLAGEYAAQNIFPEGAYIIRTSGLYGGKEGSKDKKGGNFVLRMLKEAEENTPMEVSSEQTVSTTSAQDLSRALLHFLQKQVSAGIYHLVNEGQCSWYEFAREIYRLRGIKREVVPVDRKGFSDGVNRPMFSALANTKARAFGITLPPWQDGLYSYLQRLETYEK